MYLKNPLKGLLAIYKNMRVSWKSLIPVNGKSLHCK